MEKSPSQQTSSAQALALANLVNRTGSSERLGKSARSTGALAGLVSEQEGGMVDEPGRTEG